jgi:hypothetical protein
MISMFVKQTTSVESQRVARLVGSVKGAEFQRRACKLFKLFYDKSIPENSPEDTQQGNLEESQHFELEKRLEVTIVSATNLPKTDILGSVDPFCQIMFDGIEHQTEVRRNEYNPSWIDDPFYYDLPEGKLTINNEDAPCITVSVFDWDRLRSNDFIGSVVVPNDVLGAVLNSSNDEDGTELELTLTKNGLAVHDSSGSASILKLRLKNMGMIISGCEYESLKKFFLLYDTDGDGNIDEDEFFNMLREISYCSNLFTGTENGISILKNLNVNQVRALLLHEWSDPSDKNNSPVESIIANIQNQSRTQNKPEQNVGTNNLNVESVCDQIQNQELENESNVDESQSVVLNTVEENHKELMKLAKTLRRKGVVALPTMVWGGTPDEPLDSEESSAIRCLFCVPHISSILLHRLKVVCRRVGFVFQGYKVEYWYLVLICFEN